MTPNNIVVGLDIGTTKISCTIAEIEEDNTLKIIGVGTNPSNGLRRGVVVNLEKTVQSISKAVAAAELMAGVEIESVFAGIAGDHIRSINSRGVIAVSSPDNEITKLDIERVIDAAKAVSIPMDREIIHVIPQEFIVDDQGGIKDPIGMSGVRLEAEVHIVTGAVASAQNIYKSIKRAGLAVQDIVLEPLASSYAVLDEDEKEIGVILMDIGGGTTDIAIFFEGSVRHTAVVGLGGNNVTSDIAIGLRTPLAKAEQLKIQYGCALANMVSTEEMISVPGVGGRHDHQVPRQLLAQIIEPRMEEILSLAYREIRKTDYADILGAGIVVTGGASMMEGVVELTEEVFGMPTKLGIPNNLGGLSDTVSTPQFATGVGLILYGLDNMDLTHIHDGEGITLFDNIFDRMKNWFKEFF